MQGKCLTACATALAPVLSFFYISINEPAFPELLNHISVPVLYMICCQHTNKLLEQEESIKTCSAPSYMDLPLQYLQECLLLSGNKNMQKDENIHVESRGGVNFNCSYFNFRSSQVMKSILYTVI